MTTPKHTTQIVRGPRRRVIRDINAESARDAVGPITPGMEVYGLSKGQFSLVELIEHVLQSTGPADLVVSTWTAAGADLRHTKTLLDSGLVRSARWLVDFSFPSRQPAYCDELRARFGDDAIRCTANHAKFVTVTNSAWAVVIRTSMNLNLNRRLESYEVSEDGDLSAFLLAFVDSAFAAGDGAATIDAAVKSAHAAQVTVNNISGAVRERERGTISFVGGRGIGYKTLD
jgi:hypothetical protein